MTDLGMAQRAAVVLAQLDDDRAQKLLNNMSESDVIAIMAEMARLPILGAEEVRQVVMEFAREADALLQVRQGGAELAQRWLRDRLGMSRANEVMSELDTFRRAHPLDFLNRIDPQQIVGFIREEHPQTVALVLANIQHEHAARVIERLDEDLRIAVARRIAKMAPVPAEVIKTIATELESRLSAFVRSGGVSSDVNGIARVVALLNSADRAAERQILAGLESADPELAERIRSEMFVFDDVIRLDEQTMQIALRSVVIKDLALALKGKPAHVVEKFTANISERAAEDLVETMSSLGPQRLSAVEAAEAIIVKAVRELAEAGEIVLGRASDELVG